jgi:hypothetical protein
MAAVEPMEEASEWTGLPMTGSPSSVTEGADDF